MVGAFIVQLFNEEATVFGGGSGSRVLIMGLVLVAVVLFMPAGLLPTVEAAWRKRRPARSSTPTRPGRWAGPAAA